MFCIVVMFYSCAVSLIVHIGIEVPLLNCDKVFFGWLKGLGRKKKT